jgi:hypothetical protein
MPARIWYDLGKNWKNHLINAQLRGNQKGRRRMKQTHAYRVDLTKIDGGGEFPCPRCGVVMSPDDDTEETYLILGSKADDNGLEEMVIQCNKCSSHVHLTGFSLLQKLSDDGREKTREKKVAPAYYIAHV